SNGHVRLALLYEQTQEFLKAIDEWEEFYRLVQEDDSQRKEFFNELRRAVQQDPTTAYWRKRVELASKESPQPLYRLATYYARLGQKPKAYEYLEKACDQRDEQIQAMMYDLAWDRSDQQFKRIARKVGLLQ